MRLAHHLTQHILPTKHNGFVPKLLREKQVIGMLVIGLAAFTFGQYAHYTGNFGLTADVYPAAIVTLTNQDRQSNSLPAVTMSAVLQKVAQRKADDMAAKGYFAHTSPDGKTPWYWFAKEGYSFIYAGENLAVNFDDTGAVEDAWLNSPTHRANILNKNFTEMGVATATGQYNGRETTFVVEEFGMPATAHAATAAPTAAAPAPAPASQPATAVAGESAHQTAPQPVKSPTAASHIAVLKETPTFSMVQNTNQNLQPAAPAPDSAAPDAHLPFYQRLLLHSDKVAGLVLQIILILAIISVAGMVAREYEKHHRKHMAYGALIAVIMFTSLFVGRFGFFAANQPLAAAPTLDTAVLQ